MIEVRKRHPAFGLGDVPRARRLQPVRARLRAQHTGADGTAATVLCVNNLSRFPQPVELDLSAWLGSAPARAHRAACRSRRSASCPTCLTLPGHGFYWFSITPPEDNS